MRSRYATRPQCSGAHVVRGLAFGLALLLVAALAACSPELKRQATAADPASLASPTLTRSAPTVASPGPTPTRDTPTAAAPLPTPTRDMPTADAPAVRPAACALDAIAAPTRPADPLFYLALDPATGLHITGEAVDIELADYRLEVTGNVDRPLSLTFDDLRCMSRMERRPKLVCPGFFEDVATWAGVPLKDVLELAGVQQDSGGVRLVGADGYSAIVAMDTATSGESFLAYEWENEPLPVLHGFPVRAVFPDHSGSVWVKWLVRIDVIG